MRALLPPLAASLVAQAVASLSALTPPVFAVAAAGDLGISAAEVGGFTVLLFLAATISAPVGGAAVARLGPIRATQLCLLCCAAGSALVATGSLWLAALGGLVVGIGYGPMTPASSHLLAPVTSARSRPFVFSLKQTSVPVGGVVAGLMVPALTALAGWRAAALAVAAIGLMTAVLLAPLRARLDRREIGGNGLKANLAETLRALRTNGRLRQLGLTSLAFSAMQLCLGAYLVTYLAEDVGLSLALAGFVLSCAQGAGIAGRLFWGAVAERFLSSRRLLALLGLIMAAATLATAAMTAAWPLPLILAVGIAFGASAVGWNGIYLSEIVRVTSVEESAAATGGVLIFTFGGMMVGPAVFGLIAGGAGFPAAFALMAVVTLLPALILLRREPAEVANLRAGS